jgi:uncharacterized membrane protein
LKPNPSEVEFFLFFSPAAWRRVHLLSPLLLTGFFVFQSFFPLGPEFLIGDLYSKKKKKSLHDERFGVWMKARVRRGTRESRGECEYERT